VADLAVPFDTGAHALNARIDALRSGWAGHNLIVRERNFAYLRAFSPDFHSRLGEHDQWPDPYRQEAQTHYRSSYNLTRAVVELWASLEASEFPAIRWQEEFVPSPAPSLDEQEAAMRQMAYRSQKIVARNVSTIREQVLMRHLRRAGAKAKFYQAVLRKDTFGHSWVKTWPDQNLKTFRISTKIDPSTVFPVWSYADDDEGRLDAILVAYRRSAQAVNAEYPGFLAMATDGISASETGYYTPTQDPVTDADRRWVWVEDYWLLDDEWESEPGASGEPIRSRVINALRINGRFPVARDGGTPTIHAYEGWKAVPYIPFENDNLRDRLGFADVATMLPIQDSINRFMSQQQDVIHGESRPKFKYRGDADRQIVLDEEEVISLDPDEDIEQIAIHLDVFPTQIHGQQLADLMSRATGLPDTVWGRITAAQNSGRALATAWRAVAARLVPRVMSNNRGIHRMLDMWLDWMELYNWSTAKQLYAGNRDYDLEFPNQEPRDFSEVSLDAISRMQAGLLDSKRAIEATGETSPDEVLEDVRADYLDTVLHPEKAQSFILLQKLRQQVEIEAAQAGLQMQAALQQLGPGPGQSVEQQAGAATQANTQAAQQAAPTRPESANAPLPATQAGQAANAGKTRFGTLVQDGKAMNRVIDEGTVQ
jgi:hypothetical protein